MTSGRSQLTRCAIAGVAFAAMTSGCVLQGWGSNGVGELGDGTTTPRSTPAAIGNDTDWIAISAGGEAGRPDVDSGTSCAIRADHSLWCWGMNDVGQLGDGTPDNHGEPAQVGIATDWTAVSAGPETTCGIRESGTLWCWGDNEDGQVGDGSESERDAPVQVGADADWRSVSAGGFHTCALKADRSLWCWGADGEGAVGDGGQPIDRLTPSRVGTNTDWRSVSAGEGQTCGVRAPGNLYCWGSNGNFQLGDGTQTDRFVPTSIDNVASWKSVDAGGFHTCGVRTDNTLWCWGFNNDGEVGNGNPAGVPVSEPLQVGTATSWRSVSSGGFHTCGVRTDNTLWCWGANQDGQLGDGTNDTQRSPELIRSGVLVVDAGMDHTLAIP